MKKSILSMVVLTLALAFFAVLPGLVRAHEGLVMDQTQVPASFEKIKQLVGTWTGTTNMNGKEIPYTVTYELTAGGSAVLEKLFVGSPHEMFSVYYPEGNTVVMTHYCMLGNQPHLQLDKVSGNTLSFNMNMMSHASGVTTSNEPHMHHLNLVFVDANHLRAEWTQYKNGAKAEDTILNLTRS